MLYRLTQLIGLATLSSSSAFASEWGFEAGESAEDVHTLSLLYRAETTTRLESIGINLSRYGIKSYQDSSLFRWNLNGEDLYGATTNITFSYDFEALKIGSIYPVIEFGTGLGLLADVEIGPLDLGSAIQFKNHLGIGLTNDKLSLMFFATHLSNAGIVAPNDGIDILSFALRYKF